MKQILKEKKCNYSFKNFVSVLVKKKKGIIFEEREKTNRNQKSLKRYVYVCVLYMCIGQDKIDGTLLCKSHEMQQTEKETAAKNYLKQYASGLWVFILFFLIHIYLFNIVCLIGYININI